MFLIEMGFARNLVPAIVAAVAAWLFGALYYGALAKPWVAAQGKTMEQFKAEQAANVGRFAAMLPFILSFIAEIVMAWVLSGILTHLGRFTVRAGMISGALVWFGFVLTTMAVNHAYTGCRWALMTIDAAHWLGALLIMGAVLGWLGS
jgi:hypothetical protein